MDNNLQGLLKMNLQLLADDSGEVQDTEIEEQDTQESEESKTYSEEELNARLQSETDKRVTEALKKAQSKWEKEYSEKLKLEKSEAEKLAKMSAEERAKAEFEKEKEKFEKDRIQFQRDQLELETVKELSKNGLDTEFSSFLMGENAETTNNNIKIFKDKFDLAVERSVTERLKGKTPKATGKNASISAENLKNMTVDEINANWDSIKDMKL